MENTRTPSITFDLEDRQITTTRPLLLEFSNTAQKQFSPDDTAPLKKVLDFSPPPATPPATPSFLDHFNQMFAVTFDSDFASDADDPEYSPLQDHQTILEKNLQSRKDLRRIPEIDFSFPVLAAVPSVLQQCEKGVKSEIFRKESCFPNFHIKRRVVFKDKKNLAKGEPLLELPATCRNQRKCTQLFFTSKATPRDSQIANKLINREEGKKSNVSGVVKQARKIIMEGQIFKGKEELKAHHLMRKLEQERGRMSMRQRLPALIR